MKIAQNLSLRSSKMFPKGGGTTKQSHKCGRTLLRLLRLARNDDLRGLK
ncbi:MAG: hypothetical protein AAGM40_19060 [Cyanobacteria bacterium J06573_2]